MQDILQNDSVEGLLAKDSELIHEIRVRNNSLFCSKYEFHAFCLYLCVCIYVSLHQDLSIYICMYLCICKNLYIGAYVVMYTKYIFNECVAGVKLLVMFMYNPLSLYLCACQYTRNHLYFLQTLDGEMQKLVYDNYNKFITATETIKEMKNDVFSMDDDMESVRLGILCMYVPYVYSICINVSVYLYYTENA